MLDRSRLHMSFEEDFRQPVSRFDPATGQGRWKTNWDFSDQATVASRTLNDELEIYSDSAYNGVDPFIHTDDGVAITAAPAAAADPRNADKPYTSGLLTTSRSFTQRYGYFEMRARLPQGAGLWPAFWLYVPLDPSMTVAEYPGEIDVMEMLGRQPDTIYCSAHWPANVARTAQRQRVIEVAVGSTADWRSYGALWTEQHITWYVDDNKVAAMANPGLHEPMMILANLAVGGGWGGPPTPATRFPAQFVIRSIRAYQLLS